MKFNYKASVKELCKWVTLALSSLYYKPSDGKPGIKQSIFTLKQDGSVVSNEQVVEDVKAALNRELCCCGYHKITSDLRDMSYIIKHKKVYHLMDESNLLLDKVIRTNGKRDFVQYRKINAQRPIEYICLDIKYLWVYGEKRNYYLLTILDVYSRKVLCQILQASIRKMDVINLLRQLNLTYGIKGVTVRNDNGAQFIANNVRKFLKSAEAKQEFTHIATPEENAYIEAFHSIEQKEVVERKEFMSFYEAKITFQDHSTWYNNIRKHGMLGRITPQQKWDNYKKRYYCTVR
jgi:transposase InsO family protein